MSEIKSNLPGRILLTVPANHMERNQALALHHAPELYLCPPGFIPLDPKLQFRACIIAQPVFENANGRKWIDDVLRPKLLRPNTPMFIL